MEEARWWCTVKVEKQILDTFKSNMTAQGSMRADSTSLQALIRGNSGNSVLANSMVGTDFVDKALQAASSSAATGSQSRGNGGGRNGKPKPKPKPQPKPLEPKTREEEVAAAGDLASITSWHLLEIVPCFCVQGADLKKEHNACLVALELPKGHDLRAQLNVIKVEMAQMLDSVKEDSWDKMTEKDFRSRMNEIEAKAWVAEDLGACVSFARSKRRRCFECKPKQW